jgi:flavodoxin
MKSMVVYSSKTGNTRKIGEAVLKALPEGSEIYDVENAPLPQCYDFIAMGFWVDKGMPDEKAKAYMAKIKDKKVGIFMTLGAYPDSEHAIQSANKAKEMLKSNEILGTFICQGRVDPQLVRWMQNLTKDNPSHPHAMDEKRRQRLAEAEKHPSSEDCENATIFFEKIIEQINGK